MHVGIACSDNGISEIPRLSVKRVVLQMIATGEEIFECIHKNGPAVAMVKCVEHHQIGDEMAVSA